MEQLENCIQRVTQSATPDPLNQVSRVIAGNKPFIKTDGETTGELIFRARLQTGSQSVVVCFK
jgi:hypothetical protein